MSAGWSKFSVSNGSQAGDNEDTPACASCKKRKLRCSRETPTCSHCQRLATDCVYHPKQKPGLKPGAVEALTRRVSFLEAILLDDAGNVRQQYSQDTHVDRGYPDRNREQVVETGPPQSDQQDTVVAGHSHYSQRDDSIKYHHQLPDQEPPTPNPLKRKLSQPQDVGTLLVSCDIDVSQHLPAQPLLSKLADFFCVSFHHWIPYIHKQRLQTRVRDGIRSPGFDLVLHALVAVGLRHIDPNVVFLDLNEIKQQIKISRSIVETHAIRSVSIESLQALIFLVFDHLNDGQVQRAWPLIGSLTRTIEYLQQTTEPLASQSGSLMQPVRLVQPSNDWTELEERRRLFWVIFLLDRFCSISTGWNTSLTADDVHRRLPADGGYFTREEPVTTPYFGIWNKAAARIGRSLAHVPAQYNEEDPSVDPPGASPNSANGYIDASKLGAFAYCVEATESLSQVTTFFLQQRINWQDKEHAINWLTRFKELDLRLVHWKIFLPPKWKDSNISADRSIVDMDPNLTLAHITHNTSMIMLHHPIAFPPRGWNNYVALPRECSAQTCELAAVETSNIVDKFLAHTLIPFVSVQFSFCAFVAAKALLCDHQYTRRPLRPEFQRLVRDLWNMAERWTGKSEWAEGTRIPSNQAGMYAHHLEYLLDNCQQDAHFTFDLYDHSCQPVIQQQYVSPIPTSTPQQHSRTFAHKKPPELNHMRQNSFNSAHSALSPKGIPSNTNPYGTTTGSPALHTQRHSVAPPTTGLSPHTLPATAGVNFPTKTYSSHGNSPYTFNGGYVSTPISTAGQVQPASGAQNQSVQDQSLVTLSDTLMDAQFLDMDRVITFEDTNFFMPWQ